jgi:hypothetical protein
MLELDLRVYKYFIMASLRLDSHITERLPLEGSLSRIHQFIVVPQIRLPSHHHSRPYHHP